MVQMQDEPLLESERLSITASPRVLTPNLVVMLGSTSAIAGLELMRHMLTLRPADQRRIVLVYIDTDDPPAPLVDFRRQHNNVFLEFPLRIAVPAGISNATRIDESDQHTFIRDKIPQYFANGAGGIRNNGHVAACFNYQYIYDVLDRAVMAMSRLGTDQNATKVHEVQANIISFLGGGTGSGILADIAVMVRDLLTHRQYKQRINLFCMLPEPISGVNLNDLRWRKSNTAATLLELLAYSKAAALTPSTGYQKYMRGRVHTLTNDPIANEVYLVGHASMDDAGDTARIVGLDLFQRSTDASGVGFLEHSKWVDRRSLGAEDDRGLPTMFGTSCPLEVRFPSGETARAFAQISASYLLPHLASYRPGSPQVSEVEKQAWRKKWRQLARFDANVSDPLVVKVEEFRDSEFENAAETHLDMLWARLERFERTTNLRIKELIDRQRLEEQSLIRNTPQQVGDGAEMSLINRRVAHLLRLQQEYEFVLNDLRERGAQAVPSRPNDLESRLTKQIQLPGPLRALNRNYASAVAETYNERLLLRARAERQRLMENLLKDLVQQVQATLEQSMSWLRNTGINERTKELRDKGMSSMAWHGRLEYPHPHQRHIFDLHTLRSQDDRSIAVENLYYWATVGKQAERGQEINFLNFVAPCLEYMARHTPGSEAQAQSIDRQVAGRLAERVVDFFYAYYQERFATRNLFDLLSVAAPQSRVDQTRNEQISGYFLEHLQHIRGLMSGLVAFEAELWQDGPSALDSSVYLGIHWFDGGQEEMLDQTLNSLGPITRQGLGPLVNNSLDPHRLQVSYGQHAISLSTIRDFYLEQNSAMEYYREYQRIWTNSQGKGLMPVHSSGEVERLVTESNALGYNTALSELVLRRPTTSRKTASQNGHTISGTPNHDSWGDDL